MNEVQVYQEPRQFSVAELSNQVRLIQEVMHGLMKKDEHYGVIPGTGTKPTLLKAGAEKLCLTFRLAPDYEITEQREGTHLTVLSKCILTHIPSGQKYGAGMGSCSTRESKYAWRKSSRKCPECNAEAIITGKKEYGGGFVCFKKKGGCGAKYDDLDQRIVGQQEGRVPNEDVADQYNTVLKMANKRSLVAAVLNATAASDIFTQDIEDLPEFQAPGPAADLPTSSSPGAHPAAAAESGPYINADQHIVLMDELKKITNGEARFKVKYGIERITLLPASQYAEALAAAKEVIEKDKAKERK